MAGRGFAPYMVENTRVIQVQPTQQPSLPDWREWHEQTHAWWKMWGAFPLAADFTESDWAFLIDTAMLQDAYYGGELKYGAEIRLRVAKFGQTIEDRARLKVTFASGTEAEEKMQRVESSAAERRKARLSVVGE